MSKTIKQLTHDLGVSRYTVETRMRHIPNFRRRYTRKSGNRVLVNAQGCQLLKSRATFKGLNNRSALHIMKDQIHIEQKTNQQNQAIIKHQEKTIDRLSHLLNQQQELQANTEKENQRLRQRLKKPAASQSQLFKKIPRVIPLKHKIKEPNRKPSFWDRFFGIKK